MTLRPITELDNQYPDQPMWVIGRGISLEKLTVCHLGLGPIVAINQAVEKVEDLGMWITNPLYSMQKDRYFFKPRHAAILAHAAESAKESPLDLEQAGAYVFDCEVDFGYPWNVPSVVACAGLALRWGCSRVIYLCCDAVTDRDTRAYGEQPTYPVNYLFHGPLVQRYARLPVEWKRI